MRFLLYGLAATCCVALVWAPPGRAQEINTFKGNCASVPVTGYWPEPLKFTPQNGTFIAILDGGSCTGTLNGQPIDNLPITGRVEFHGVQSCMQAEIDGRAHTVIDGKNFYASVHERRTGREAAIAAPSDAGGATILKAYGRIGLVKDSDPIAQDPLVRPLAEPMDFQQFEAACAGPGLTQVSILIELAASPTGISSPANEDSWQSGPPPGSSPLASLH
jgi:hypothetical protein